MCIFVLDIYAVIEMFDFVAFIVDTRVVFVVTEVPINVLKILSFSALTTVGFIHTSIRKANRP